MDDLKSTFSSEKQSSHILQETVEQIVRVAELLFSCSVKLVLPEPNRIVLLHGISGNRLLQTNFINSDTRYKSIGEKVLEHYSLHVKPRLLAEIEKESYILEARKGQPLEFKIDPTGNNISEVQAWLDSLPGVVLKRISDLSSRVQILEKETEKLSLILSA